MVAATAASAVWTAGPASAAGTTSTTGSASATAKGHHHRPPPYGPKTCTVIVSVSPATVGHGGTITVELSGDCFRDTFAIVVFSSTRTLGTITTDASGHGSKRFALPCAVNVGSHTVIVVDAIGNSGAAPLRVTPGPCASAPGHQKGHGHKGDGHKSVGPPHQGGQHQPRSGSDLRIAGVNAQAGVPAGAAALGVAGLVVLRVRKRRGANGTEP